MINKIASTIEMSFDIPESEQKEAQLAVDTFKEVINALDHAQDHLDLMYEPFKKAQDLTPEAVWEYRGAIRRYKDQIKENYNKVMIYAFKALLKFNLFSSDTHVMELINSFKDSITDVEDRVQVLLDALDELKDQDFKTNVISAIDDIKKKSTEVEKIIEERIEDFINNNILTKDWTSSVSDDLNVKIREKVPYITQLFNERQEAFEQIGQR